MPSGFLYVFVQKLVDEVSLTLARHLGRLADPNAAVRLMVCPLLDLKQAHIHRPLGRHIVALSTFPNEKTIIAQPLKQAILTDIVTILAQNLGKVPQSR